MDDQKMRTAQKEGAVAHDPMGTSFAIWTQDGYSILMTPEMTLAVAEGLLTIASQFDPEAVRKLTERVHSLAASREMMLNYTRPNHIVQ
jgi:hypothetical protein